MINISALMLDELYGLSYLKSLIRPIRKMAWLRSHLIHLGVPREIIGSLDYLNIPPEEIIKGCNVYRHLPKKIKPIPVTDVILSWLGGKLNIPVVSMDHHLQKVLKPYTHHTCLRPEWLFDDDDYNYVLIDTNILYPLTLDEDDWRKEEIMDMFQRNKRTRFILISRIYYEFKNLVLSKEDSAIYAFDETNEEGDEIGVLYTNGNNGGIPLQEMETMNPPIFHENIYTSWFFLSISKILFYSFILCAIMESESQNVNVVGKLQKFLKNLHKFDKPKELFDWLEDFREHYERFIEAVKADDPERIKKRMRELIIELINYANTKDIDISELLREGLNI